MAPGGLAVYAGQPDGSSASAGRQGRDLLLFPRSYVWALVRRSDLSPPPATAGGSTGSRARARRVWYDLTKCPAVVLRGASLALDRRDLRDRRWLEVFGKDTARLLGRARRRDQGLCAPRRQPVLRLRRRRAVGVLWRAVVGPPERVVAARAGERTAAPKVSRCSRLQPVRRLAVGERASRGSRSARQRPIANRPPAHHPLWPRAGSDVTRSVGRDGNLLAGPATTARSIDWTDVDCPLLLETKESSFCPPPAEAVVLIGPPIPARLSPRARGRAHRHAHLEPFDAANVAAWGRLSFTGEGLPERDRAAQPLGNTEKPRSGSVGSNPISYPAERGDH